MLDDRILTWEEAANRPDEHPGVLRHQRTTSLPASTPAERMTELTSERNRLRSYLSEACAALRAQQSIGVVQEGLPRWLTSMKDTSFAGIPAAQLWVDLYLWEAILNENPALRGVIEIGTWRGGLSLWLQAQTRAREMSFYTVDAVEPESDRVRFFLAEGHSGKYPGDIPDFERVDVFAHPEKIDAAIQRIGEPLLLFCDGGNKPRELQLFAPRITDPQSLVLVHDWGTETMPEDVPAGLVMVYGDVCEQLGSMTRAFRIQP